jgi:hypothetical protein
MTIAIAADAGLMDTNLSYSRRALELNKVTYPIV